MPQPQHKIIPMVPASKINTASRGAQHKNRAVLIKWLRKFHSWIGLWGALLGLLFGTTGILLNHRAIMKIPAAKTQESVLQLQLPSPAPANVQALSDWLQQELHIERQVSRVRSEPQKEVAWGDKTVMQPEHWTAAFNSPGASVQAEYWKGNNFVSVKRHDNNLFATLNNLHKGTGVGLGWVLLVDTLAGSILFLSLSGVLLWALMNKRRMVGTSIALASLITTIVLALRVI